MKGGCDKRGEKEVRGEEGVRKRGMKEESKEK